MSLASGKKDGGGVTLEQAMHRLNVDQSCIGCHESKQTNQAVPAATHLLRKNASRDTTSCANCHMVPKSQIIGAVPKDEEKMMAAQDLESPGCR